MQTYFLLGILLAIIYSINFNSIPEFLFIKILKLSIAPLAITFEAISLNDLFQKFGRKIGLLCSCM